MTVRESLVFSLGRDAAHCEAPFGREGFPSQRSQARLLREAVRRGGVSRAVRVGARVRKDTAQEGGRR